MQPEFWNGKIEFLQTTRNRLWNDDYFAFLVERVWQLNAPMRVIDFGCGYGFLGTKLMPLLPPNSTYTGLDIAPNLLAEARRLFKDALFPADFIQTDLNAYVPSGQHDLAICQAVLRHTPNPKGILAKMVASVKPGGLIVCIEVDRQLEEAGNYIHSPTYNPDNRDAFLRQRWQQELSAGGRDYRLGIKIPVYMEELGLENIGVRLNDCVEYLSPNLYPDGYPEQLRQFCDTRGLEYDGPPAPSVSARALVVSYGNKA